MNELTCSVVRDLLPSYAEALTSRESNEAIKDHLEHCAECAGLYETCKTELAIPQDKPTKPDRKILRGMRLKFLWYFFWPLFYALCCQFGRQKDGVWLMIVAMAAILAIPSYSFFELYFDDDKRREFYQKQSDAIDQKKPNIIANLIGQTGFLLLPMVIPVLCGLYTLF